MRKNKIFFILLMILCVIMSDIVTYGKVYASEYNNDSSEIVMELNSNRVIYSKNANAKKFMASTTKILTAITVIENANLEDLVTVTNKTVGIEGSSIYLEAGEKLTVKDLLYGLMLRSGNDCAETLAVYVSGSIENFANLMNETARKAGAFNSNFVNPHGLPNDNHYTTAYDLALISCYAMKNDDFREIVGTKSIDIPFSTRNCKRRLINKNKMLKDFEGSTGIKTGYTKKAGRCLVSSCFRDGAEYICVVLNCNPMFERSKELLQNAFDNYKPYKLVESDNILDFINVKDDDIKCGVYVKNDVILPLTKEEKENLTIKYNYPKEISKPIQKDAEIGKIEIYNKNNLIFEEKVFTIIEVK